MKRGNKIKISAVYYPDLKKIVATWENEKESVSIMFPCTEEQGEALSRIVWPCVYTEVEK